MKKSLHRLGIVMAGLSLCLWSCQDSLNENFPTPTLTKKEYLSFKTFDEFYKAKRGLESKSSRELYQWEESKGFISFRSIFQKGLEEQAIIDETEASQIEQNHELAKTIKHQISTTVKENPHVFINRPNGSYLANITDERMGSLLNKDGIVMIEGNLHQYSSKFVKTIFGDNASAIKGLSRIVKSDESKGIFVSEVKSDVLQKSPNARPSGETRQCTNGQPEGGGNLKYHLTATEDALSYYDTSPVFYGYGANGPIYQQVVSGQHHVLCMRFYTEYRPWWGFGSWDGHPSTQSTSSGTFAYNITSGNGGVNYSTYLSGATYNAAYQPNVQYSYTGQDPHNDQNVANYVLYLHEVYVPGINQPLGQIHFIISLTNHNAKFPKGDNGGCKCSI